MKKISPQEDLSSLAMSIKSFMFLSPEMLNKNKHFPNQLGEHGQEAMNVEKRVKPICGGLVRY